MPLFPVTDTLSAITIQNTYGIKLEFDRYIAYYIACMITVIT